MRLARRGGGRSGMNCISMDRRSNLDNVPPFKRKKLRRGTRSCWECKRRKMKCVFERPEDAVCVGCHRRWTQCVSQEFPEQVPAHIDSSRQLRDRLRRVESRLDQVLHQDANSTPARSIDQHPHPPPAYTEDTTVGEDLSHTLYSALPSPQDIARIATANSHHSIPFHEILTTPYSILDRDSPRAHIPLLSITATGIHPVLIARHMLHLASFLQHLHPDLHDEIRGLSEPPSSMRDRLAEMAIRLVTTRDQFVGSVEFLECIMMQSLYEANCGYLRRSWMTTRRAMTIAQSMGFHQSGARLQYQVLHPDTKAYPHFMWFRIVFYDRQMCLLLGMPDGSLDRSMGSEAMLAQDSPVGRLERQHCVIMSRLLERSHANPAACSDYALTQELDGELHRCARALPSRWWLTPNLSKEQKKEALFCDMRRLSAQLCHYNLLNQLHLPYLLRRSVDRQYDYSRITCVNASREILSRFMILCRWNRVAFSCRTIDFTALMAAMTLLLAHLNRYRSSQVDDFLNVQALGDRALIEQAQEHMEELDRLNADPLSARSARLLRRLLVIEEKSADSEHLHCAQIVRVENPETASQPEATHSEDKHVYIPYFGVIQAAGEIVSAAAAARSSFRPSTPTVVSPGPEGSAQTRTVAATTTPSRPAPDNHAHGIFGSLVSEVLSDDPLQLFEYPGMAGGDNGTFHDMDLAFLDNLMRGTGEDIMGATGRGNHSFPKPTTLFPAETVQLTNEVLAAVSSNIRNANISDVFNFADPYTNSTLSKKNPQSCKVMPGDVSWPRDLLWNTLDTLLGKRLIKTVPLAAYCYPEWPEYDADKCANIISQWAVSNLHLDDPASVMMPLYEGRTCMAPGYNYTNTYELGGYPTYTVAQIQLAVNFARNLNLRFVVKNTGHDFSGKSSSKGALSIWTHWFKDKAFYPQYKAASGYVGPAIKFGSGVQVWEAYEYAKSLGVSVVGGEAVTVGLGGGHTAGGGHSPLSSIYGMAADQVLAMEVILANGRFITASSTENSDIFWMLRGVTFNFTINDAPNVDAFWKGIEAYFDNFEDFVNAGTYGYYYVGASAIEIGTDDAGSTDYYIRMHSLVAPNMTIAETKALLAPWYNVLDSLNITYTPWYNHADNLIRRSCRGQNRLPQSGAYMSEADLIEPNLQEAFYGANYPALYALKQKYDPTGLFFALTAVGAEDWEVRTTDPLPYSWNNNGRLCPVSS
ncbi:hypothetical protein G4B11_002405 [Aspergillus flavus]|nr:hypothetical protein G4B11_002405 [Aspergillus flavus]